MLNRNRILIMFYLIPVLLLGMGMGFLAGFITGETLASRLQRCSQHYGNAWDNYGKPKKENAPGINNGYYRKDM